MVGGASVVVPVFRSTRSLDQLVTRLTTVLADVEHEIVLVDDGSPDPTWAVIEELAATRRNVRGVRLGRNIGQHGALVAGVRVARYPITVTLDDDLQNPPEEIPRMMAALTDEVDVVYGIPIQKAHVWWRNMSSRAAKWLIARAVGARQVEQISNFRLFRTQLRGAFAGELGPNVSLDALLGWATQRFASIPVQQDNRAEGESNYRGRTLRRYALDVLTGYSIAPLQVATGIGLVTALFGVVVLAWVVGRALIFGSEVPGFPFLASTLAIFSGAQLVALGIIGEYIARIHFRVMGKPTYIVVEDTQVGSLES